MPELPPEKLQELEDYLVERIQKRVKPRHVYKHGSDFTEDEVSQVKTMLAIMKWSAGVLSGCVVAIIGLIVVMAMSFQRESRNEADIVEIKADIKQQPAIMEHNRQLIEADVLRNFKRFSTNANQQPDESGTP